MLPTRWPVLPCRKADVSQVTGSSGAPSAKSIDQRRVNDAGSMRSYSVRRSFHSA